MNFVEPIQDRKKIAQIKNLLHSQGGIRDLLLFTVGVNSPLQISDMLQLQIGQFLDDRARYTRLIGLVFTSLAPGISISHLSNPIVKRSTDFYGPEFYS